MMDISSRIHCTITPPSLLKGATVKDGIYFRNLKKADVSRHYEREEALGCKIKVSSAESWEWSSGNSMSLSVNQMQCVGTAACSIASHPTPEVFSHVWEINLELLNEQLATSTDCYLAQYLPTANNPCHFCLISEEGGLSQDQILYLLNKLANKLPPEDAVSRKKPPRGEEEKARAMIDEYRKVVTLHLNIA
jgi:hypothetical protein